MYNMQSSKNSGLLVKSKLKFYATQSCKFILASLSSFSLSLGQVGICQRVGLEEEWEIWLIIEVREGQDEEVRFTCLSSINCTCRGKKWGIYTGFGGE